MPLLQECSNVLFKELTTKNVDCLKGDSLSIPPLFPLFSFFFFILRRTARRFAYSPRLIVLTSFHKNDCFKSVGMHSSNYRDSLFDTIFRLNCTSSHFNEVSNEGPFFLLVFSAASSYRYHLYASHAL